MRRTSWSCDRCAAEMEGERGLRFWKKKHGHVDTLYEPYRPIDLCAECIKLFEEWMGWKK